MIASWMQQLGWTRPPAGPEVTAVRPSVPHTPQAAPVTETAPETVAQKAPAAPFDPEQVHQIALNVAALRQTVEQLAAGQDQMAREIEKLQTADMEILAKIPAPPLRPPAAAAVAGDSAAAIAGTNTSALTDNTSSRTVFVLPSRYLVHRRQCRSEADYEHRRRNFGTLS